MRPPFTVTIAHVWDDFSMVKVPPQEQWFSLHKSNGGSIPEVEIKGLNHNYTIRRGYLSENQVADPRQSISHVLPPCGPWVKNIVSTGLDTRILVNSLEHF